MNSSNKVYVYCPMGVVTGGTELLHQLVDYLNNNHYNAYVYYLGKGESTEDKIPAAFSKYNISVAPEVEDSLQNTVVLPEVCLKYVTAYSKAKTIVWWLSMNNSFRDLPLQALYKINRPIFLQECRRRLFHLLFKMKNLFPGLVSMKELSSRVFLNAYQAEYIHFYLEKCHVRNVLPLKDYINTDFLANPRKLERKNRVLYNPLKGYRFTKKLIKSAPGIEFVPLKGYNREQLLELFQSSKLYIDFGTHPGKDRLPREAALNGCCIITGMQGAASFFEDVSIPAHYKFDEKRVRIRDLVTTIEDIFNHYEQISPEFDFYRKKTLGEKEEFFNQIHQIFIDLL